MNKTPNYQLNQWAKSDRVLMDDFNADNLKIDSALNALAATVSGHTATLGQKGNCKIAYSNYTGTGSFGAASPRTLTLPFTPLLVIIQNEAGAMGDSQDSDYFDYRQMILVRPVKQYRMTFGRSIVYVSWSGNSVSWYGDSDTAQMNATGRLYHYVAIG